MIAREETSLGNVRDRVVNICRKLRFFNLYLRQCLKWRVFVCVCVCVCLCVCVLSQIVARMCSLTKLAQVTCHIVTTPKPKSLKRRCNLVSLLFPFVLGSRAFIFVVCDFDIKTAILINKLEPRGFHSFPLLVPVGAKFVEFEAPFSPPNRVRVRCRNHTKRQRLLGVGRFYSTELDDAPAT